MGIYEDLNLAGASEGFDVIKHNETNFDSYRDFQSELDKRFIELERNKNKAERLKNLKKWDSQLSHPWNKAKLDTINDVTASEHATEMIVSSIKEQKREGIDPSASSFFIRGDKGSGKTFMALAIARRYIGFGLLTPSQVHHISEEEFLTIAKAGFRYNEKLGELLNKRYKLFIIDNVSSSGEYNDLEITLWGTLLEHISKNQLAFIFTSNGSARGFNDKLSQSAQSKFSNSINGRIIRMSGNVKADDVTDDYTEGEIESDKEYEERANRANRFKQ